MLIRTSLLASLLSSLAMGQTTYQVPLDYNFNGIVHTGEAGLPDDLLGYRSISDRGLDFSAGIPSDPILNAYSLVNTAGALDIVHLGNRNTVSGGVWAFQATANGDGIGVQPTWLTTVDQSTPQTTTLATPIMLEATSTASFLLQVSDGGGTCSVLFGFQNGSSTVGQIGAGDWFGGIFPGTDFVDQANPAVNLSITEATVNLSGFAGQELTSITFQNAGNQNAGYAILAANVTVDSRIVVENPVPLNYNFNGIVHDTEGSAPDDPNGYRSISDRALNFSAGIPAEPLLEGYTIVDQAGELDVVHLGDRNTVSGGAFPWQATANGDDVGVQPSWLTNSDQTGPQTTMLAAPIEIAASSEARFLYQISNGGGSFDVTFGFQSGGSGSASLSGGDWFGGTFLGTDRVDFGSPGANLSITEGVVDLSAAAGQILTSITFSNRSNTGAGYAIIACNVTTFTLGSVYCSPAVANSTGNPGLISAEGSPSAAANNVTLTVSDLPPNSFGFFLSSETTANVANPGGSQGNLCLGGAIGRFVGPGQIKNSGAGGTFDLQLDLTQQPSPTGFVSIQPGESWSFQAWHRDAVGGTVTSNFTNGLTISFL
ncbi:MAG: hypothetical protein P8R46_05295 [Planctomycetota bacterium]|nr:hypothetical protein [Planctomycetota bacterium]